MASLNRVFLMGNLTRDPELRYLSGGGTAVCEFGIAVNRRFTQSNGQEKDEACFVDIVVWGKQAESCHRFLQKGSNVFIEGRLVYETWTDNASQKKRSRLRVTAERVQFVGQRRDDVSGGQGDEVPDDMPPERFGGSRGGNQQYSRSQGQAQYSRKQYDAPRQEPQSQQEPPMPEGNPLEDVDDIPF